MKTGTVVAIVVGVAAVAGAVYWYKFRKRDRRAPVAPLPPAPRIVVAAPVAPPPTIAAVARKPAKKRGWRARLASKVKSVGQGALSAAVSSQTGGLVRI